MLSYCMSIVLAFSCGRAKKIPIHYFWTRIFSKTEEKIFVFKSILIRVDEVLASRWRQTANLDMYPVIKFFLWLSFITHYYYTKIGSFMSGFIHRKNFAQVLPVYFPISESNCQLEFVTIAVCLDHFSKSLYRENRHSHLRKFKRVTPPPPSTFPKREESSNYSFAFRLRNYKINFSSSFLTT